MIRLIIILTILVLLSLPCSSLPQGIWKTYTTADGLAGNVVQCIAQDKLGNMWFGTRGNGLSKLDTNGVWTNFMNTDSTVYIYDIEIDSLNNKWLALAQVHAHLFGTYVVKFDDSSFTYYSPTGNPIDHPKPLSLGQDSLGHIWCGTTMQLAFWFDGVVWHPWYVSGTGSVSQVNEIRTDRQGKLYFAHDRGIATLREYLDDQWHWLTYDIAFDKQNRLWCAGKGFGMFDGQNWNLYAIEDGLLINRFFDVAVDSNSNIWIANQLDGYIPLGVSKFDGHSFTHFNREHGLAYDDVDNIYVDKEGAIWFGTYGGGVSVLHDTTTTRIKQIIEPEKMTETFSLFHNYPNPFNGSTAISYLLKANIKIELLIYNLMGKEVIKLINEKQIAGKHEVKWNGKDNNGKEVVSGIYLAVLKSDDLKGVIKLTLIR
jgi:ligand-binding sensor domain-containing protein